MSSEEDDAERLIDRAFTITLLIAALGMLAVGVWALVERDWSQAATSLVGVVLAVVIMRRGRRGARARRDRARRGD